MARPSRITLGNATSAWDTGSHGYDGAGNIITMMKQMIGDDRTTLFGYSADGERVETYDSVVGATQLVLAGQSR